MVTNPAAYEPKARGHGPWTDLFARSVFLAMVLLASGCAVSQGPQTKKATQTVWPAPPEEPRFLYERSIRTSTDIIPETTTERLKRLATGSRVGGQFIEKPYGLAAMDGVVFVTDTQSRRVSAFDLRRKKFYDFGTEGIGNLAKPLGIAIDGQKRIYVCDGTAKRVVIFDFSGKYLNAIGGGDYLTRPTGVAVSKDGDRIYVVDTGGVDNEKHQVVVFAPDGRHLMTIGKRGAEAGQFNLPLNAAVAPDGTLYVVDGGNFRVQAFNPDGTFKMSIGAAGRRSGQFSHPKSIAVDADGNIYVSDSAFGNFQIFDAKGQLLMWVGNRGIEDEPGQYLLPAGIGVDPTDGRVFFADQFFRKVDVYRPAIPGQKIPQSPPAAAKPLG